jgi:hypothetical protein
VHVALGQALIIYMYALPHRANKSAVVTVGKPIGGDVIVLAVSKAVRHGGLRSIGDRGGISKTHVIGSS